MARNRRKKALYEVMSKAKAKPGYGKTLEQMQPKKPGEDELAEKQKTAAEAPKAAARWWRKPRIVQFNAGRFEFSVPYQLVVALGLVFILLILAAYRLGQSSHPAGQQAAGKSGEEMQKIDERSSTERAASDILRPSAPPEDMSQKAKDVEPLKLTGDNVIVLVEYGALADLGPVQAHFAEHGIETEIVPEDDRYFLQTKQRYDNPATPGTDGYEAKQKIIEVGAKYKGKAPAGYETFAPHYFSDAYGKSVK
jgi:hypothetical protein